VRAVLDANVVVSAFLRPEGPSGRILRHFVEKKTYELILSEEILAEIRRSLQYPRVRKYLKLTAEETEVRLASLGVLGDIVPGELKVRAVPDDLDDDKYVAAALEGRADFIVSGDHHLRDLKEHQGIRIVSPREFMEVLEALPPAGAEGQGPP
jgi:hypothetical protein